MARVHLTATKGELRLLEVANGCTTVILLFLMITHCVQSVTMHVIPYGHTKSGKI